MSISTVTPGCQFASDNTAPMSPGAWESLARANEECQSSYGDDSWTARACELIREIFECPAEVFFVFNGTAANSLALAAMCQSYHAILCHEVAHVETDECGAPEFFSNETAEKGTQLFCFTSRGRSSGGSRRPPRPPACLFGIRESSLSGH